MVGLHGRLSVRPLNLRDTGLASFLLGIDSATALERSPFVGAMWETFIAADARLLAAVSKEGAEP